MSKQEKLKYIIVTGRPGVGKTTLVLRVAEKLASEGYIVKGFVCPEVRQKGRRIGFKIKSIDSKLEGWLAHVNMCRNGPRVGRYTVCPEAGKLALKIVEEAIKDSDLIVIDEIGPMELRHPEIKESIKVALKSGKLGLYVVHLRLNDKDILPLLRKHGKWFTVTEQNRDILPEKIYTILRTILAKR